MPKLGESNLSFQFDLFNLFIFRGNPYPTVIWQHGTYDVKYDDRIEKLRNNSIFIKSFQPSDTGSWIVTAFNNIGDVARGQTTLKPLQIEEPLKINVNQIQSVQRP